MYHDIVKDSKDLNKEIERTGMTDSRKALLDIMGMVEEILYSKKLKAVPEESEKLDVAQGRIDTEECHH